MCTMIKINGVCESVVLPCTLFKLIREKGLIHEHVVVEMNKKIVASNSYESISLSPGDALEILTFVGGG